VALAEMYRLLVRCIGFCAGVLAVRQRNGSRSVVTTRKHKREKLSECCQATPATAEHSRDKQVRRPATRTQRVVLPRQIKCIGFWSDVLAFGQAY